MQKIMFNDKYGLTQAVLEGRKTMTRRIAQGLSSNYNRANYGPLSEGYNCRGGRILFRKNQTIYRSVYAIGEIVAVAQSYKDVICTGGLSHPLVAKPGWTNKMYVRADLMPHQLRITNVQVEKLQDISDEECIREGIVKALGLYGCEGLCERGDQLYFTTPREAFAVLIDKISGRGTWKRNPWVFVYEFELVL